jgi:hypothetical protein
MQWGSAGTEAPGAEAAPSSAPDDRDADGAAATGGDAQPKSGPMHTTSSWWDSTSGTTAGQPDASADKSAGQTDDPRPPTGPQPGYHAMADGAAYASPASDPPDIGRALAELGRALLDDRTGGTRGRIVRAVVGWLPIAFGIGWLAGELTGCGRFAATCDAATEPFVIGLQIAMLGLLLAIPILASVTTMATITLLVVASFVALVLSATGSAADDASRRIALGWVLLISWLAGVVIAGARRVRSATPSVPPARPVS